MHYLEYTGQGGQKRNGFHRSALLRAARVCLHRRFAANILCDVYPTETCSFICDGHCRDASAFRTRSRSCPAKNKKKKQNKPIRFKRYRKKPHANDLSLSLSRPDGNIISTCDMVIFQSYAVCVVCVHAVHRVGLRGSVPGANIKWRMREK